MKLSLGPVLVVETLPSFNTTLNIPFSLICNVRAELDENPLHTTIEWTRIPFPSKITPEMGETIELHECIPGTQNTNYHEMNTGCVYNPAIVSDLSGSPAVFDYQSILQRTENGTDSVVIYQCRATAMSFTSYSDTTVYIMEGICSIL